LPIVAVPQPVAGAMPPDVATRWIDVTFENTPGLPVLCVSSSSQGMACGSGASTSAFRVSFFH